MMLGDSTLESLRPSVNAPWVTFPQFMPLPLSLGPNRWRAENFCSANWGIVTYTQ
jgi:hypothetical protein